MKIMKITFPDKGVDVAEAIVEGTLERYRIPPVIGTHPHVFQALSSDAELRVATGEKVAVYAYAALCHKKNEWEDQKRIGFPMLNYLRFPNVLTIVPQTAGRKKFGDLEGGLLVDSDVRGKGIDAETKIPKDLTGWKESAGGILTKGNRIFVPYNLWYKEQWDENNGAAIALAGIAGAELLAKAARDSGKPYKPLWKDNPYSISAPVRRVSILNGFDDGTLALLCSNLGDSMYGCGVGVLK